MAGLLDQFFYGGMQSQADPNMQEAALTDLFRRLQPAQQIQPQPQQAQAQAAAPRQAPALPEPNFLDRLSALSRGYDKGGLVGGIADMANMGNTREERALNQQANASLDFLRARGVDDQQLMLARHNPEVMKALITRTLAGPKPEEFKEVDGQGFGLSTGPDGRISARRLDLGTPTGNAALPGTIEGAGRSYKSPKEVTEVVAKLRGDFESAPAYKDHAATAAAYNKLDSAFKNPSPAGDIAATYAFMKMMDPGSVVRESEFMMLGQAGSLPEKIQQMFNRAATGQGLTPDMRADIQRQARGVYEQSKRMFGRHQENYRGMAQRFYVDPANVVYDMAEPEIGTAQAPPAPRAPLDMTAVQGRGSQPFLDKTPMTPEQAAALPKGTPFYTTDGRLMVKN